MTAQSAFQEQAGRFSRSEGVATDSSQISVPFHEHPLPVLPPSLPPASGVYSGRGGGIRGSLAETLTEAASRIPISPRNNEELGLDVDGFYPQMVASGSVIFTIFSSVLWIADLVATSPDSWTGNIWYKYGAVTSFPYTTVSVQVVRNPIPSNRSATVTFSGGGGANRTVTLGFQSPYFRNVGFEFDSAEGESPTLFINSGDHPNRPVTLPIESLSIPTVFQRAGFYVTTSTLGSVPIAGAGPNARWSDQEMHDAMQIFWSYFNNFAQWNMWVFFASLHEVGTSLGGIMFDDIGPNHRQGTAIFNDSFISNAPPGDLNPVAWAQRMIFWTACHEMGHGFNLAHSWQKQLGTSWIPLTDEPEARSFMNYPYNVAGGQAAFFANFEYRFSNGELLFMRHAPGWFVMPGGANWFDDHGFQDTNVFPEPTFRLELRVNRERAVFEFLEPVTLELKLTNTSLQPQLVDEYVLSTAGSLIVILKKQGQPARQFVPYAQYCLLPNRTALMPGESIYESLFVSAGLNGWDIAEPGTYTVQVGLHVNGEDIISNPLRVRMAPPRAYDEEFIAQDFFSEEVGRIIAFDGSRFFDSGNNTLHEVADKLKPRRVALHASLALGNVLTSGYKKLVRDPEAPGKGLKIEVRPAQTEEAQKLLSDALTAQPMDAVESFGHIDYKWYVDRVSEKLDQQNAPEAAAEFQDVLYKTMSARKVHGRKILDLVLREIRERRDRYAARRAGKAGKVSAVRRKRSM